jgi:hypothetical protein
MFMCNVQAFYVGLKKYIFLKDNSAAHDFQIVDTSKQFLKFIMFVDSKSQASKVWFFLHKEVHSFIIGISLICIL